MKRAVFIVSCLIAILSVGSCRQAGGDPLPGALSIDEYINLIRGKKIAVVANQTSMAGQVHLVDFLIGRGIRPQAIFAPEHGFRDLADAGEKIEDGRDPSTGIMLISLYGSHLKPTPEDLKGIDIVISTYRMWVPDFTLISQPFITYLKLVQRTMSGALFSTGLIPTDSISTVTLQTPRTGHLFRWIRYR
jgi:uncharacterized protein YbbC (DUF1343 family)